MWKYSVLILLLASGRSSDAQCSNNIRNENQQKDTSSCIAWGNFNIKTFDDYGINFGSKCGFTITSFKIEDGSEFKVDMAVSNNCKGTKCPAVTTILWSNREYILDMDEEHLVTFSSDGKSYPIPSQFGGVKVTLLGSRVAVDFTSIGVSVKWNKKDLVEVTIENKRNYKPLGLCGNNDGCSANDQRLKNNEVTDNFLKFLEEWLTSKGSCGSGIETKPSCNLNLGTSLKAIQSCAVLRSSRFKEALQVLNPDAFIEACFWNYCSCQEADPTKCLCDTFEAYARAAIHAGARKVDWRNSEEGKLCSLECPGDLLYFPCAPMGGPQTCDADIPTGEKDPEKCEEGCYCTANTFLYEDRCYIKKRCPCSFEGTTIKPGSVVTKDCRTCTCTDGKIVCPEEKSNTTDGCVTGDPHFTTWDGRKYDFMGKCAYYLVNGNNFNIISDHYVLRNGKFIKEFSNAPSYMRRIVIEMDGQIVELKPGLEVVVNGAVVKQFPHWAGKILITKPSGSFVLVDLPNCMEIQWDGYATGIFRAPIEMEGKLRGLLGTFTENRDDDFAIPDGTEVTDANIFGNSWKTDRSCRDEPPGPVEHPCVANPGVKPRAEKICSVIKGSIFKPCGITDLQGYYDNCMYDACYCEDNPEQCACDQIAVMADKCVKHGVSVDWRKKVPQCAVNCPAGQVYQECGDSCTRSCEDLSLRPNCRKKCVEGCNCPPGSTLDEEGTCIAIEKCKCKLDGVFFPPDYQILKSKHELLTCKAGRWRITVPTDCEQKHIPTEDDMSRKCKKLKNSRYTGCKRPVTETCENMHDYKIQSSKQCEEGCECINGYVFNPVTKTCDKPEQCPCFDNGRSHKEGSVVERNGDKRCVCKGGAWVCGEEVPGCREGDIKNIDDKKCACKNGNWKCVPPQCHIWGDSHVERWDGIRIDFQGECSYILAAGSLNGDGFSIHLENGVCSHTGATCLKSITISITIAQVTETITLVKNGVLPNTKGFKKIKVTDWYLYVEVEIVDIGLKLYWDLNTWLSIRLDDDVWRRNSHGLCCKQDSQNRDIPIVTLEDILRFVDMWRLDVKCPPCKSPGIKCDEDRLKWALSECEVLKGPLFSACHSRVPVKNYYDMCVSDSCKCDVGGDCECLCTALKAYAQRCNDHGISIKWRSQKRCPVQCPDYTQYDPCMSVCPPRTCQTLHRKRCEDKFCIEGCAPPRLSPGFVYVDDTYRVIIDERNCPGSGVTTETPEVEPPPAECDPRKCPRLRCPANTILMKVKGQCCESCQHESKCIIENKNGDIIFKEPGETWMEGFCRECACVGNQKYNYCARCRNKVCSKLGSADKITEDIYYELTRGPCCSKLEPLACVYKDKIYKAGEIWDVDECLSIQCVIDPQSQITTMVQISPRCQQTCPIGFRYKKLHNSCCGYCVQDSCVFNGKARRVGEEWYSEDGCIVYNCQVSKGQYQVYSYETVCPVIRDCSGNIRRGRCCEYCDTFEKFTWKNEPLRCGLNGTSFNWI